MRAALDWAGDDDEAPAPVPVVADRILTHLQR